MEMARFPGGGEFVPVEEIGGGVLISEKEPVSSGMSMFPAVLEEGAKGSDPGAGAHHDDVPIRWRKVEMAGRLHINRNGVFRSQPGQITGGQTLFGATMGGVLNHGDGQMDMTGLMIGRGGDGVEPGGDFIEKVWNLRRVDFDSRCILEDVHDIPIKNIFLQFFFIGTDGLKFVPGRAGSFFRDRFDEFFARPVQNEA